MRRPSAPGTPGGWRRTRSRCAPPSWSGRTPPSGRKWPTWGRSSAAAETSSTSTRAGTETCEEEEDGRGRIRRGRGVERRVQPKDSSTLVEVARGQSWSRPAVSAVGHRAQTHLIWSSVFKCGMPWQRRTSMPLSKSLTLRICWFPESTLYTVLSHRVRLIRRCACARCCAAFFAGSACCLLLWPVQTGCWVHSMPVKSHFLSSRHGHKPVESRCVIVFFFGFSITTTKIVYFWTGQEGKTSPAKRWRRRKRR